MKKIIVMLTLLANVNLVAQCPADTPKLVLSAQATLHKPADELQLKVAVVTIGKTAELTVTENNEKMHAVVAGLEKLGLVKTDYETGQFAIQPTYTPYPTNPPADWKPSINGYEVTNTLLIHTDKLDLAGKLIDVANKAGANSISDIRFGLSDPRIYWSEALAAASTNAVNDAKVLAAATGVELLRVLSVTLDNTRVSSPQMNVAYLSKSAGNNAPPIQPGEVTLTANVTLTYEIK